MYLARCEACHTPQTLNVAVCRVSEYNSNSNSHSSKHNNINNDTTTTRANNNNDILVQ